MEPKHRFMSAYEQRIEPPDKAWQYLLVAAEPYETIGFKVGFDFSFFFLNIFTRKPIQLYPKQPF